MAYGRVCGIDLELTHRPSRDARVSPAIETAGLRKSFGDNVAIEGLNLTVEQGDVFGLLSPNGADKTTTIRMLTTLLVPDSGAARVGGFDVSAQPSEVRQRIGYVMQRVAYRGLLTGRECVEIEAALYHLPRREIPALAEAALAAVGMLPHADRRWTEYSGGMQKRLDLACGLLHSPEVLVLDEPILGLDVQSRHNVWEFVRDRRAGGATILLATNYLDEADRLCNKVAIIDHGRVVVQGPPSELKRAVGADVVEVSTPEPDRLRRIVETKRWVKKIVAGDMGVLHIFVGDAAVALPAVMRIGLDHGIGLERMTYSRPSLDDVFLLHTGRDLREASVAS